MPMPWWTLALLALAAALGDDIAVVRLQLSLEEEHALQVNSSVEYILQFVPTTEQSQFPSRVWVRSAGGDAASPLLVTARQRAGAITWQLPYYNGETLLYELERTLCPDDSAENEPSDCENAAQDAARRGEFSLHVGSACAAPFSVRLRAAAARDWRLSHGAPAALTLSKAAPRVVHYRFAAGEDSVRLVVESDDDVCATLAVQDYTCPITQTLDDIEGATTRMTVLRSGGVQLSRARYPRGFYVIGAVHETDAACGAEEGGADDSWLWEEAVWPAAAAAAAARERAAARHKRLTVRLAPSLTQTQYLIGTLSVLAMFLSFYLVFGALVLAQRWPRWNRLVGPKAVLAKPEPGLTELEGADSAAQRRRRRDSDATFDSSDNSDSESDDDATTATATTTAATTPPLASPGVITPPLASPGVITPPLASPDVITPPLAFAGVTTPPLASPGGTTPPLASPEHLGPGISTIQLREDSLPAAQPQEAASAASQAQEAGGGAGQAPPAAAEGARPFGLPARLHVAALARRRGRVLRARSDRYLYALYTVAVFYTLPVVQFVAAFQMTLNVSGSLDMCYYNFLCAHPLGALSDFNHVFSNFGYLLLGALFLLQLRRRRRRRARRPRDEEYGIPQHYGLLSSLGAGMMVVALLSASYHVCPNRLNFQFDTAFMYVLAVLCMVKIYQSRHPDINARAHATFGALAALIALVVWGVLAGGALFWSLFTVAHVFTFLLLSLRIYYVGQFRLEKESLAETARSLRRPTARPLYTARLVALLIANAVNWGFALYGLVTQTSDIASHLLSVLLCNALLYIVFYVSMKLLHGERLRWYAWLYLAGAAGAWAPALYFFQSGSTDWSAAPAASRLRNHECRALHFYDSHDLWHALSAVALYLTFNAMLTWDDGLSAVKRTEIAVF